MTLEQMQWEQDRQAALRTFEVYFTRIAGRSHVEHVLAHYYSNENPAGHLNFYIIEPSGRHLIPRSFANGTWSDLREITPPEQARQIDEIAQRQAAQAAGAQGLDQLQRRNQRRDRKVH